MKKSSTTGSNGSPFGNSDDSGCFKILKLKTGEILMAELDDDEHDFAYNPTVILINPILVSILNTQIERDTGFATGENFTFKPYLIMSDDERLPISSDVILTLGNMKVPARRAYERYVSELRERRQQDQDLLKVIDVMLAANGGRDFSIVEEPATLDGGEVEEWHSIT